MVDSDAKKYATNTVKPVIQLVATCPAPFVVAYAALHFWTSTFFFNLAPTPWTLVHSDSFHGHIILTFHICFAGHPWMPLHMALGTSAARANFAFEPVSFYRIFLMQHHFTIWCATKHQVCVLGNFCIYLKFLKLFKTIFINNRSNLIFSWHRITAVLWALKLMMTILIFNE